MKILPKAKIFKHNLIRYAVTEWKVMTMINHPFIIKLKFSFQTATNLYMVLHYCPGGDLSEYLNIEWSFTEWKAWLYLSEILSAIEELHSKGILFRDLKPDNVVLDEEGHAVLTDFGLSKENPEDQNAESFCGSYAYLAPEMIKWEGHGKSVDWYLLGVFLYEMLFGIPPYYDNDRDTLFQNILSQDLHFPHSNISENCKDLLLKLLNKDPSNRLGTSRGAEEIKEHPWFESIDWELVISWELSPSPPYLTGTFNNNNLQEEIPETIHYWKEEPKEGEQNSYVPGWYYSCEDD